MSNNSIYHYTYIIIHYSAKYYIGMRSCKCQPEYDLGYKYFSSSTDKNFKNDQIKNPSHYKYVILKTFKNREDAIDLEIRLHKLMNVGKDLNSYNKFIQNNKKFSAIGTVSVKDCNGNNFCVSVDDPRYISGELVHNHTGMVPVIDKHGNTFKVDSNDKRFLTGELNHVNVGMVTVKDKDGNTMQVEKNDPRYISGELKHIATGMIVVKDKDGNIKQVEKGDPRYMSGELVGIHNGKIRMTNGRKNISVNPEDVDKFINDGYELGMKKNLKENAIG